MARRLIRSCERSWITSDNAQISAVVGPKSNTSGQSKEPSAKYSIFTISVPFQTFPNGQSLHLYLEVVRCFDNSVRKACSFSVTNFSYPSLSTKAVARPPLKREYLLSMSK